MPLLVATNLEATSTMKETARATRRRRRSSAARKEMDTTDSAHLRRDRFIGRPLPRFEDLRLVRGTGRYTDDVAAEQQSYAVFVRAPHAHADIVRSRPLRRARGRASWPCLPARTTSRTATSACRISQSGRCRRRPAFRRLWRGPNGKFSTSCNCRWRSPGSAMSAKRLRSWWRRRSWRRAMLPSRSRSNTRSSRRYRRLEALASSAPAISPDAPDNLALDGQFGDRAAVEAAIDRAHLVIEQTIRCQRTASAFLEPRAAIGSYDAAAKQLHADFGMPGRAPPAPSAGGMPGGPAGARAGDLPRRRRRLRIAHQSLSRADRGGLGCAPGGRPVKWTGDRTEAFLTDYTARDVVTAARLAFDRRGRMLALALS